MNIEEQIQAASSAPRITPADIEANIASECYFTAADALRFHAISSDPDDAELRARKNRMIDGLCVRTYSGCCVDVDSTFAGTEYAAPEPTKLLTFCVLVLRNGFTVTGESACASPENFNAEIGRKIARENAINKVRPLMGYELRSKLTGGVQ